MKAAATGTIIRPATIDDLSAVRYIHSQALKNSATTWAEQRLPDTYGNHIYSLPYGRALGDAIAGQRLLTACLDDRPVATCGWSSVADDTDAARIRWCHVLPMFTRLGLATALLRATEHDAIMRDHTTLVARASPEAAGFFERFGYVPTARGSLPIDSGQPIPVVYLRKRLVPSPTQPLF